MRSRSSLLLAVGCAASLFAGCGLQSSSGSSAESAASGESGGSGSTPAVQVDEVASGSDSFATPEACGAQRTTVDAAANAFRAQWSAHPASEAQLIEQGFLAQNSEWYDIGPSGQVVAVAGAACEFLDAVAVGLGQPVDAAVPANPVPTVNVVPMTTPGVSAECTSRRRSLEVAIEAFVAQTGVPPASEVMLVEQGYLREAVPAMFQVLPDGQIVATPGGGCG